jgi:uncharacterized membrane protein YphA (DoxX/SURF4 family)
LDANLLLWAGQVLLALAFLLVGYGHAPGFEGWSARPGMGWMAAVGRKRMRVIGLLEIVGAIGLILPGAAGVLPWLTPLAATCLAVVMALAAVLHARRPGEVPNIVTNLVLGVIALPIAYGRFVVAPF